MYLKLRLTYPQARHIICAYNLKNEDQQQKNLYNSDYCDDGEIGAGRHLLKILHECDLTNRAVFVVRKCGEKLGPNRFIKITNAAKRALRKVNEIPDLVYLREDEPIQMTHRKRTVQYQDDQDEGYKRVQHTNYRSMSRSYRRRMSGRYHTTTRNPRGRKQGRPPFNSGTKRSSPQSGDKRSRQSNEEQEEHFSESDAETQQKFVFSAPDDIDE